MDTQPNAAPADRSGPVLAVALEALESDAARWTEAAARLRAAAAAAADQVLDAEAFSFAGDEVAAVYEALRRRTVGLLQAGAANLDGVAGALRATAAAYAEQDAAQAHRLAALDGRGSR